MNITNVTSKAQPALQRCLKTETREIQPASAIRRIGQDKLTILFSTRKFGRSTGFLPCATRLAPLSNPARKESNCANSAQLIATKTSAAWTINASRFRSHDSPASLFEGLPADCRPVLEMLARCYLRHHAAIWTVRLELAGDDGGEDGSIAIEQSTSGVVARGLNSQDDRMLSFHSGSSSSFLEG